MDAAKAESPRSGIMNMGGGRASPAGGAGCKHRKVERAWPAGDIMKVLGWRRVDQGGTSHFQRDGPLKEAFGTQNKTSDFFSKSSEKPTGILNQ